MTRRNKLGSVSTSFGSVNRAVLEALQDSFDTQLFLDLVDQLDELRCRICDPEGLRADLHKLHTMAHSVINSASIATEGGDQGIWELADDLESELAQIAESARQASSASRLLVDLQPDDPAL